MNINITSIGGVGSTYLSKQIQKAFENQEEFNIIHGHLLHALKRPLKRDSKIIYFYGNCLESFISRLRRSIFLRAWINFFRPIQNLQSDIKDIYKNMTSFEERQLTHPQRLIHNIRCFNEIVRYSLKNKIDLCSIKQHFYTAAERCKDKKEHTLFLYFGDPDIRDKLCSFFGKDIEFEIKPRNSNIEMIEWFSDINKEEATDFYQKIDREIINEILNY